MMSGLMRTAFVALLILSAMPGWASAQFFNFSPPAEKKAAEPEGPAIAVFELRGAVTEKPGAEDSIFGDPHSESLQTLIKRMDAAAEDEDVKAVVLLAE